MLYCCERAPTTHGTTTSPSPALASSPSFVLGFLIACCCCCDLRPVLQSFCLLAINFAFGVSLCLLSPASFRPSEQLSVSDDLLLRRQQQSRKAPSQNPPFGAASRRQRRRCLPGRVESQGESCYYVLLPGSKDPENKQPRTRALGQACRHGLGRQDASCLGPRHGGRAQQQRRRRRRQWRWRRAGPEAGRADELEGGGHGRRGRRCRAHAAVSEPSASAGTGTGTGAVVVRAGEAAAAGARAAGGAGVLRAGLRRRPVPLPRLPPPPQGLRGALQDARRHRRRPAAALLPAVQQVRMSALVPSCRVVPVPCRVRTDASPSVRPPMHLVLWTLDSIPFLPLSPDPELMILFWFFPPQ